MTSILQRILDEKQKEVTSLKDSGIAETPRVPLSLKKALEGKEGVAVIAEIKRQSPSKGVLNEQVDPVKQAKEYEKAGAAAISVLTDGPFFKGSFSDLAAVRQAVAIPVLCKDFIIDSIQIKKAKSVGADAVLLIVAALSQQQLEKLYEEAKRQGLEVLVEVHDESELEIAVALGANLIGINNRDLSSFQVNLETTVKLSNHAKLEEMVLVSESGIRTKKDAELVHSAGASAILVGETLMKADNILETIKELSLTETESLQ